MKTNTNFSQLRQLYIKKLFSISLVFSLLSFKAAASDYYWIGGSGNWSELTHWATNSGGSTLHSQIPTALDNVYFDANSFTQPGQSININVLTAFTNDLNWTGVMHTPSVTGSSLLKIYGSLTFVPAMNMNFTGRVDFDAIVPGKTITMAGKNFPGMITFKGIGGEWTLQDGFSTTNDIWFNSGILNTNNKTLSVRQFNSYPGFDRTINMGASVFNLSSTFAAWNVEPPGLTINSGTSVINMTRSGHGNVFYGSGFTYYDLNFILAPGNPGINDFIAGDNTFHNVVFFSNAYINHSNTFNNLTLHKSAEIHGNNIYNDLQLTSGYTYILGDGSTQTINGNLDATGSCGSLITINSFTNGTTTTVSHPSGAVSISYVVLKDVHATGGATFTATNSSDLGNNTGWAFTSPGSQNLYWIGNSGNWSDGNHWSFSSGGSPAGCSPSPSHNVFFDANSFTQSGQTVSIDVLTAYVNDMNWTGVMHTPSVNGTWLLKIYGSLTFVPDMNMNIAGRVDFDAIVPGKTITMAGKIFPGMITFKGIGGEWTLQDGFSTTNDIWFNSGILNTNNKTLSVRQFNSYPGFDRTINMGASVFNLSSTFAAWNVEPPGLTINSGTSVINMTRSGHGNVFYGSGFTYYDLNFILAPGNPGINDFIAGDNTFHNVVFFSNAYINHSNTFNNLTLHKSAEIHGNNIYNDLQLTSGYTYILGDGSTQTINGNLDATGSCGSLITINSFTNGTTTTVSHPSGAVSISYVVLKDVHATGGATFTATNSSDLGNNTGWAFTSPGSQNLYWIGNSGNWSDGNHWSFSSGGSPAGCSPSPSHNVFFDANSFTQSGQTVSIDVLTAYVNDMNWTGVMHTPSVNGTGLLKIYGSLTFVPDMNMNIAGRVDFDAIVPGKTITMAGKIFPGMITFKGIGGEWTLQDGFSTTNDIWFNSGILNTNNKTLSVRQFNSYPGFDRTINMGASVFNLSSTFAAWNVEPPGLTINSGTSVINMTRSGHGNVFYGSGFTYYDLNFILAPGNPGINDFIAGDNTFHNVVFFSNAYINHSNTFNNLTLHKSAYIWGENTFNDLNFTAGYTYILGEGSSQTINNNWLIQGTCNSYILLKTSSPGTFATINKATGSVAAFNTHIRDIHSTGGASFIAYNCTDLGGNTGWNFSTLPSLPSPGSINGPSSVCSGSTAVYQTSPVSGAISYQWTVPAGATITSGQGSTMITVHFGTAVSGNIAVQTFNGCNYGANSSLHPVVITTSLNPSVTIAASPGINICAGTAVTFTASIANTGTGTVVYDFKINGSVVQSSSSNTYTSTLANQSIVTCTITVTGGGACISSATATSNALQISIGLPFIPAVSLIVNPPTPVCAGDTLYFTAATNTGNLGVNYNFIVNGNTVQNSQSNVFASSALANNDVVSCTITITGDTCAVSSTAHSNSITVHIISQYISTVTLSLSPDSVICPGTPVTFTAIANNTGSGVITYNFWLNGSLVQNSALNTYTSANFSNGDNIICRIDVTGCVWPAVSNHISVHTIQCDSIVQKLNIYPNPVRNNLFFTFSSAKDEKANITIINSTGSVVHKKEVLLKYGNNAFTINSSAWASGKYILLLSGEAKHSAQFIKMGD